MILKYKSGRKIHVGDLVRTTKNNIAGVDINQFGLIIRTYECIWIKWLGINNLHDGEISFYAPMNIKLMIGALELVSRNGKKLIQWL